ncbi:MAG: DUF6455 family protein [Hyphomicrobium sp.]|uniref:DUF6455 family protein n=1 Tax=Hyphomicrobium sp. TaxID=82 RepID=UPI001320EDBC|nr:DUF6455 family protein [Hyphomicrobium sp.]KAB2943627.1 MAG: hypothetical protein F9K20_02935 [Hyphomicrobium sp.]MBZ0208908.1 DUF6455 family protein [Hyphomicrobium sp.]
MMSVGDQLSLLDQNSPAPELMMRMMDRMAVNWKMAERVDGGLAWYAARSKCIFCRHERECRSWLEHPEALPEFCLNAKFFRRCAVAYAHDQFLPHDSGME